MGRGLMRRLVSLRLPQAMAVLMLSPLAVGQPQAMAAATGACTVSTFSAGSSYSGAVDSTGRVLTWGRNFEGELGIGSTGNETGTPTPVVTTTGLTSVAGFWAGNFTTFAVDSSGQVWGWGDNSFNQRGNNTGNSSPAMVVGPTQVVSIGPGFEHTIAVTADGTVWGWGTVGAFGVQLPGNFAFSDPIVVPGLAGVTKVAGGDGYSLALTSGGAVYAAGSNAKGELGLGSGVDNATTFQPIPGLSGAVDISAASTLGDYSVVLDQSGHVFAFGDNFYGQMGNGSSSTTYQYISTQVSGLDSVVKISAGDGHVLALKSDHSVWAWGFNEFGQLGNGSTTNSSRPVQVSFPAGVQLVSVSAGLAHSMALDSDGNLWAWGHNGDGELGNGFDPGLPVTLPFKVNVGTIASPCGPPETKTYLPSVNGYAFNNPGAPQATVPDYDRMASFYPSSSLEIFFPFQKGPSFIAKWFNSTFWTSTYTGGLCYGMASSDQFLYNTFSAPVKSLYPNFPDSTFPGGLGASPSPSDSNIEQFIDRYHSRQLAESGVLEASGAWSASEALGGNVGALFLIAAGVASGKTVWVGLGPSKAVLTETSDPRKNAARWGTLFAESHAVLAYAVDTTLGRISIYDPNSPSDNHAYIQIVPSAINTGGGIEVIHHSAPGDPLYNVSYGGGITSSGQDFGQPGEWTLMPLPDTAFTDDGFLPGVDNRHWMLDIGNPLLWVAGGYVIKHIGPIFIMRDTGALSLVEGQQLPSGTGLSDTMTATELGSRTAQATGSHAVDIVQTDAGAVGSTHQVSITPDSSQLNLSNSNSLQQYTATLEADFMASGYGRRMTVSGATLAPGGSLSLAADQAYSTLSLSTSGMAAGQANLALEEAGQGAGSASVTATVPGSGGSGIVYVGDWTGLGQSLIFESVTQSDGTITGLLLQDNAGQRQQLTDQLLQSIKAAINQVADAGVRNSLRAKLDNAGKQIGKGDPRTAANVLDALDHEVAAQLGRAVPSDLAASLSASLSELIGLQRASSV
jgi:hypothetical protein